MIDKEHIVKVVEEKRISITVHTIRRMHERNILIDDICGAIKQGEIIEEYPDHFERNSVKKQ